MKDRELPNWTTPLLLIAALVLFAMLASSCARAKPRAPRDSPAWAGCKAVCESEGKAGAMLMENDESLVCLCAKAPADPT